MTDKFKSQQIRIGLGLAAVGRPEYINLRQEADPEKSFQAYRAKALKLLDHAYMKGVRDFDTAASYGKGEHFLKDWFDRNRYEDVTLSSKWGYTYKANWEIGFKGAHEVKEHSLSKLIEQWDFAKGLLPGLKIYQIHSATFESGVLENREVLEELRRIKKSAGIQIGASVSGANQNDVILAASEVRVGGEPLFDSIQVTYNILDTSTHDVVRQLIEEGNTIIIKEALANGRLLRSPNYSHYEPLYRLMDEMASLRGVGSDAIALRFVMDNLEPSVVLSGASTPGQLDQNLKALTFQLNDEEIRSLRKCSIEADTYWSERKRLPWN